MPTYVAPNNPDCRIDCDGSGFAIFIPPFDCKTYCDDNANLIATFATTVRGSGWTFRSALSGRWSGRESEQFALAMLNLRPPEDSRSALFQIAEGGRALDQGQFDVAWEEMPFNEALEIVASSIPQLLAY